VLIASPAAAASPWVNREVRWWLDDGRSDQLIVAATTPGTAWDEDAADWADDALIPPALRGALAAEPKFVDLIEVAKTHGRALSVQKVAEIAAPIRGMESISDLIGDHLREQRRTRRLVTAAVSLLVLLTAAAVTASVIAAGQLNRALHSAQVALSRRLAATSGSELPTNLRVALVLAAQAYKTNPNVEAFTALMRADLSTPALFRYVPFRSEVTKVAASGDGTTVIAGLANGEVLRWRFGDPQPAAILDLQGAISGLAVDESGSAVAASDGERTRLWRLGRHPVAVPVPAGQVVDAVTLSPSGRIAVLSTAPPVGYPTAGLMVVLNTQDPAGTAVYKDTTSVYGTSYIAEPSDQLAVLFDQEGSWQRRSVPGWHLLGAGHVPVGATQAIEQPSGDGQLMTASHGTGTNAADINTLPIWRSHGASSGLPPLTAKVPFGSLAGMTASAFSPDDSELAVALSGVLYIVPIARAGMPRPGGITLTGSGTISSISFAGTGSKVVSAAGNVVAEWNTDQLNRISSLIPTRVIPSCDACLGPAVVVSPDNTRAAIIGAGGLGTTTIQPLPGNPGKRLSFPVDSMVPPVWDGSAHLIIPAPQPGFSTATSEGMPGLMVTVWHGINSDYAVAAAAMSDRRRGELITVADSGTIDIRDAGTGAILHSIRNSYERPSEYHTVPAAIRSAPDLVAIAVGHLVHVIDPHTGRTIRLIRTATTVTALTFTGRKLLIDQSDGNLQIWAHNGSSLQQIIPGDLSSYGMPAANREGSLAAIPQANGSIQLVDLLTGTIIYTMPPYLVSDIPAKEGVAFTPDGRHLIIVTAGLGTTVATLNSAELIDLSISGPSLLNAACKTAGGSLTRSEWRTFTGIGPPQLPACG